MTHSFTVLLVFLSVPTGFIVWLGLYLYLPYRRSPERMWRERVLRLCHAAQTVLAEEQEKARRLDREYKEQVEKRREQWFNRHLQTITVHELRGYPGIGAATVARLEQAGFSNLTFLLGSPPRLPGFGQKRIAAVNSAVQQLLREAHSRFESRACQEADSLAAELESLARRRDEQNHRARVRAQAAQTVLDELKAAVYVARRVTFVRHLMARDDPPIIPAAIRAAPFPELDERLRDAEATPAQIVTQSAVQTQSTRPAAVGAASGTHPGRSEPVTSREEPESRARGQLLSMELTIQLAYAAARADGRLARAERDLIEGHLRKRFGHDAALYNQARALSAHYETAAIDPAACMRRIADCFTLEHRAVLIDFAAQIVDASGKVTQREVEFLANLARRLGVAVPHVVMAARAGEQPVTVGIPVAAGTSGGPGLSPMNASACAPVVAAPVGSSAALATDSTGSAVAPAPAAPTHEDCLATLAIDATSPLSADLVRRQFNLLQERYAPEKFEAMGPEFVEVARGKLAAIERAAATLLDTFGEKLQLDAEPPTAEDLRHNPDLDAVFGA